MEFLTYILASILSLVPSYGSGIQQLNHLQVSGGQVRLASTTADFRIPSLIDCDTIDTNGFGVLSCGSDDGGVGGSGFSTTSADYWKTVRDFFSTTSADYWETTQAPRGGTAPVGTSTVPTSGHVAVWTSAGYPSLLGSIATGSVSGSGGISVSANRYVLNGALTILCATANGSTQGCLTGTDWTTFNNKESALTFTYPLTRSTNTIALAFGTTTSNLWAGLQTFTNSSTTLASFGYASSTLQYGAGLSTCESGNFLTWSSGRFGCGEDQTSVGSAAFSTTSADYWKTVRDFFSTTSVEYWETTQTSRTADDITDDFITDLADVGVISEDYGDLFYWNGSAWADIATSSLGINFSNIVGTITDAQVPDAITLTNITQITNRAISDTTGTLAIGRGGTGLTSIGASSTALLSNGSAALWQLIHFPGISGLLNLATQVTGTLAVGNGGTGATTLNNLITLATHTTGDYIATLSSSGSITIGNSGSENAAVTANLNMANANTWTALQTFANMVMTNATTSSLYIGSHRTTDFDTITFNYSTTSQGVGTTTKPALKIPRAAGTAVDASCHFNQHMRVLVTDKDGNRLNDFIASSTQGILTFSTNNTFTFNEPMLFYVGTTTSGLGTVYGGCDVRYRNS